MEFSTIVTRSDLAEARKIEPLVLAELHRYRYGVQAVFAVRLALEEALVNAIQHGNRGDPNRLIRVDYAVDGQRVVIRIRDEGAGFDRQRVPDPTAPENIDKPGGRGIMLMEAYMDEVRWNKRGNQVEMVKLNE